MILCIRRQQLGGRTTKPIRIFGINDSQSHIVTDYRDSLLDSKIDTIII
jgi:hypothetical protein